MNILHWKCDICERWIGGSLYKCPYCCPMEKKPVTDLREEAFGGTGRRVQAPQSIASFSDEEIAKEHARRTARKREFAKVAHEAFLGPERARDREEPFDADRWMLVVEAVLKAADRRPFG